MLHVNGIENCSGELEVEFNKEVLLDAAASFPVPKVLNCCNILFLHVTAYFYLVESFATDTR